MSKPGLGNPGFAVKESAQGDGGKRTQLLRGSKRSPFAPTAGANACSATRWRPAFAFSPATPLSENPDAIMAMTRAGSRI